MDTHGSTAPTFADLAREAEENPLEWFMPSTILAGGAHVIYGKEESFKTTLVMQMLETLNLGGRFLNWNVPGGLQVGFVELEMSDLIWRQRVRDFYMPAQEKATIHVPTPTERRAILDAPTTEAKVQNVLNWASRSQLDVLAVDSATKLFPPDANTGAAPVVSDLFSQFQRSGCAVILIAHPRKAHPQFGESSGNDSIAGSGRFAQEPDIVLQVTREDKRAPKITLSWGKNRMAGKPDDIDLFFDRRDFRLYPHHPFLHLLPASREELLELSESRYGWGRSRTDDYIASLKALQAPDGTSLVEESTQRHKTVFRVRGVSDSKSYRKVGKEVSDKSAYDTHRPAQAVSSARNYRKVSDKSCRDTVDIENSRRVARRRRESSSDCGPDGVPYVDYEMVPERAA